MRVGAPKRVAGVALISTYHIQGAVGELRRAKVLGGNAAALYGFD